MKIKAIMTLALLAAAVSGCASNGKNTPFLERAVSNHDTAFIGAVEREAKTGTSFVDIYWVNPPQRKATTDKGGS